MMIVHVKSKYLQAFFQIVCNVAEPNFFFDRHKTGASTAFDLFLGAAERSDGFPADRSDCEHEYNHESLH